MEYLLWFSLITILSLVYLALILVFDKEHGLVFSKGMMAAAVMYITAAAGVVWSLHNIAEGILVCFLFAYLVTASCCDYCTQLVHRFLYIPAFLAGMGYVWLEGNGSGALVSIGSYILLILLIFKKYFGRADSAAFIISGLFFARKGSSGILLYCLLNMLISIGLVIALKYKKINFKEGSIEPTAFMPFISLAVLIVFGIRTMGGSIY